MLKNEIIEVDGQAWEIVSAVSLEAAEYAIAMARCSGSVGSKHIENNNGVERLMAEVKRA